MSLANLWWKLKTRPLDKFEYYLFILCYVDDIISIHHDPENVLIKLNGYVPLKPGLASSPYMMV